MKKNILLILFGLICLLGHSQITEVSYTKRYRLDFNMMPDTASYMFIGDPAYSQVGHMLIQTKDRKYGEQFISNPLNRSMRTVMGTRILLPDLPDKKRGDISLEAKGNELEKLSVRLQGLDYKETVLFNDTLAFVPDTVYSRLRGDFPLGGVEMLDITIDVEGKKNCNSRIVYSGLEIRVDGKLVNSMPFRRMPDVCIGRTSVIPITDEANIPFDKIKELHGKKVIGIGESLHKHKDINRLAFRLMEEGARRMGCRLLAIEMPMEMSLYCNRYISDASFALPEELLGNIDFKDYMPLFDALRRYNADRSPDERVMLLGMDSNTSHIKHKNSLSGMFDFLCALNKDKAVAEADSLSLMLYDNKPDDALEYLNSHRQALEEVVTAGEQKCIGHILSSAIGISENPAGRIFLRDSLMAENIAFLERNFASGSDGKIMVYGHSVHLNRLSAYPSGNFRSAGSYLHEKYGSLYASFLLLTDSGRHRVFSPMAIVEYAKLHSPYTGSMESALAHTAEMSCYLPLSKKYDRLVLSRFIGSQDTGGFQFYPFNLYRRHDGIFYAKAQKALTEVAEESSRKSSDEMMKTLEEQAKASVQKEALLLEERKALVDEIRNRCKK